MAWSKLSSLRPARRTRKFIRTSVRLPSIMLTNRRLMLGLLAATTACSGTPSTLSTPGAVLAAPRQLPNDVRWFRTSAEYRALTRQAYRVATERLPELSRGLAPQSWAVILDADETVLDNSEYQRRRAMLDS